MLPGLSSSELNTSPRSGGNPGHGGRRGPAEELRQPLQGIPAIGLLGAKPPGMEHEHAGGGDSLARRASEALLFLWTELLEMLFK